jgi:hypothetical protein
LTQEFDKFISDPSVPEADKVFTIDVFDETYLGVKLAIPTRDGDGPQYARVTKRLRDKDGLPTASDNPILQKRMFEVEYPDGHKASLAANAIVETMFAQVDDEAYRDVAFDAIVDHRTDGSEVRQ